MNKPQWVNLIITVPTTILFVASCTTSNNTIVFTPKTLSNGQAAVYIYRPSIMANALYSPNLLVDDEFKLSVKNGKMYRINLPLGETIFELEEDNNQSKRTNLSLKEPLIKPNNFRLNQRLLNLKSETTYYLRVTTTLKINNAMNYEPYQRRYTLENIAANKAIIEVAECCVANDKKTVITLERESKNLQTDDGFSVNKTQNPFSH